MIDPSILIGEPLDFQGKLKIYPPRVKDVVANPNFGAYYKILTMTQEEVAEEVQSKLKQNETMPTPFEYLLLHCAYFPDFLELTQKAFDFFCKSPITIILQEGKIVFGKEEVISNVQDDTSFLCLNKENYFDFQNAVRNSVGDKSIKPLEPIDPNEDPRITEIKRRARERDRIKAKQQSKNGISLSTCLVAICCMGIGITPLNIGEMSYASVGELMKVMQEKEKYDIDIRSILAGADSKKVKPKYWIRNTND